MKKKEWICRELLERSMKGERITQLSIAKVLGVSLSTVNNAINPLERIGAVEIGGMGLRVLDRGKALAFWGSIRNLERDIIYRTRVEAPVSEIERLMPPEAIYTGYSAYKFRFKDVPADYGEVYVYVGSDDELRDRFPEKEGPPNLMALKSDARLAELSADRIAPSSQVYVDLWNMKEWYAKDFVKSLERRFGW